MENYLVFYIVVTVLGILFLWRRYLNLDRVRVLDGTLLRGLLDQSPHLIDVRSKRERELRALEGSKHLAHDCMYEWQGGLNELVVTYCSSGLRAHRAAETLLKRGYKKVYAFSGDDRELMKLIEDARLNSNEVVSESREA